MSEQKRYWNYFVQTYGHARYLHKYLQRCEHVDRAISMYTAIASSASIAGWVIWKTLDWFWAAVIAVAQVISAIKTYLPYAKRAELLREASKSFTQLSTRVEGLWYEVRSGGLTEKEINDRLQTFKTEQDELEEKVLSKVTLPDKKDLRLEAKKDTDNYFARFYGR